MKKIKKVVFKDEKKLKNIKQTRGITLVALVITIVILIILAVIAINAVFGDSGLLQYAQDARNYQANADSADDELINSATEYIDGIIGGNGSGGEETKEETKANAPVLTENLTPIKWNDYTETETTSDDADWYSYERQSGTTESGGTSRWANAKNSDGSYFVWIPRFAYKITYYTDANKTTISEEKTAYGNIDIVFLEGTSNNYVDKNGVSGTAQTIPADVGEDFTNSQKNGDKYTVHPAFTDGASNGYANGEWDEEIEGFWVAKFEMSMETDGSHTETDLTTIGNVLTNDSIKAVSKPGVSSWRYITIGNMYTNGLNYESVSNSHAIKNSEWGAVSYLLYSEYGRNGTKVTINNSSTFITGNAGNTVDDEYINGVTNEYNTDAGVLASTTGNIYGVYDMNGSSSEYIMAYITSGYQYLLEYGSSFAKSDSEDGNTSYRAESTKYATAYPQGEANSSKVGIEEGYIYWNTIYGDGVAETSIGEPDSEENGTAFNDDFIEFDRNGSDYSPFFLRGGIFIISDATGADAEIEAFRIVLVP